MQLMQQKKSGYFCLHSYEIVINLQSLPWNNLFTFIKFTEGTVTKSVALMSRVSTDTGHMLIALLQSTQLSVPLFFTLHTYNTNQ